MAKGCDDCDSEKLLKLILLDYMKKRNLCKTDAIFREEANVSTDSVAPVGFLNQWWKIFPLIMQKLKEKLHEKGKGKAPVLQGTRQLDLNDPPVPPHSALHQQRPGSSSSRSQSLKRKQQFSNQYQRIAARDNRSRGGAPSRHPDPSESMLRSLAKSYTFGITYQPAVPERNATPIPHYFVPTAVSGGRGVNTAAQGGWPLDPFPHLFPIFLRVVTEGSQQNMLSQPLPLTSGNRLTNLPVPSDNQNLMLPNANSHQSSRKRQRSPAATGNRTMDSANVEYYNFWDDAADNADDKSSPNSNSNRSSTSGTKKDSI